MLSCQSIQSRSKASVSRTPPWRKWVRGREKVPQIALSRSVSLQDVTIETESLTSSVSSNQAESLMIAGGELAKLSDHISAMRKLLVPGGHLAPQAKARLDSLGEYILKSVNSLSIQEKVKVLCGFGQLRDYSVSNRLEERYNFRPLSYENEDTVLAVVESMDWGAVYSSEFSKFRTLAPLMHLVRTLNRMVAVRDRKLSKIMDQVLGDQELISNIHAKGAPKHIVELVMIASKNRVYNERFMREVCLHVQANQNLYSEDLIGDLARSFTTLSYHDETFHAVLRQHLPVVSHELSWWNLIDIADYFNQVVPKPLNDLDVEIIERLGNECWKWIPDMRCGYAAKALRILSELNYGDKRTIRSLIRHIPRSLDKLHKNVTAESIVAAVKLGYNPRQRYGKRYGSVLYRRLAGRLTKSDGKSNPLSSVSASLIVNVVEALQNVNRPMNDLFDHIVLDIRESPWKYSSDHIVTLDRLWECFGYTRGKVIVTERLAADERKQALDVSNLAHLARRDSIALQALLARDSAELLQMTVNDLGGLLKYPELAAFMSTTWLDYNLANLSSKDLTALTRNCVEESVKLDSFTLQLIMQKASELSWENLDEAVTFIASCFVLDGFSISHIPARFFEIVTNKSTLSIETLYLCQLISAHIRVCPAESVGDSLAKFLVWIESHLVSKHPLPVQRETFKEFYVPRGAITDLSIFPVNIPLAVPDPRINLHKLHQARTGTVVRRLLTEVRRDAGIAVLLRSGNGLSQVLAESYLQRLGWTVRYVSVSDNISDPFVITQVLMGSQPSTECDVRHSIVAS
jgi:hypothetical protein